MKNKYGFGGSMDFNNNFAEIEGPNHEGGGVDLNSKTELEGGESVFGDFVFSDRLLFSGQAPQKQGGKKDKSNKKDTKMSFSDKAKEINDKYTGEDSTLAKKSMKRELQKLAADQEALKQEMMPEVDAPMQPFEGMPQDTTSPNNYGAPNPNMNPVNSEGQEEMFWGGLIAQGAGAGLDIARGAGAFGQAREFDPIEFQTADWKNADFEKASFDNVDFSQQRARADLDTEKNRVTSNATIRNNAGSSGQLLSNTLNVNN